MLREQWAQEKKEDDAFLWKKTEEKQNSVTIMMSVDEKETVFPVTLKLEGESFEWRYSKRILRKT